jgi:shikimate kinase
VQPTSIDPAVRHLACIGLMAAGKSSVGRILADELGWRFVDVDDEIEARTGSTVAELYESGGEAAYRPLERQVVLEALAADARSVLAAPGGIAVDAAARQAIGAVDVVAIYLRADPLTLAARVRDDPHERPLLEGDPAAALRQMFEDRDDVYRALADIEVQVDRHSNAKVVRLVLQALTGGDAPRALP